MHKTLKRLSEESNIKVTSFDKGNGIVILNSNDYISKLDEILSDKTKFSEILPPSNTFSDNPVVKSENSLTYYLRTYVKPHVTKTLYESILPEGSQPGKLYGMSKVHKPGCPLRPVVSMIGTAEYKLAKYLDSIIKPIIPDTFMLNSTNGLLDVLNDYQSKIDENCFMVSFDIVSLFTNVPLKEIIDIATDYVYSSDTKPNYDQKVFKKLLTYATGGIFTFNNKYYKQVDGICMGSPLGPTLSSLFLAHLEKNWFQNDFSPVMYRRYVDDIFCIFDDETSFQRFYDYINNQHSNLKFTVEIGKKEIPFLDVNVKMFDGMFETSVHRKSTYTGLCLNFHALCPEIWKKGLIKCLLNRAFLVCSTWKLFHEEVCKLKEFFLKNAYPVHYFERIVKDFLSHKLNNTKVASDSNDKKILFKLPYVGKPSLILKRKLQKILKSQNINVNIVFTSFKVANYFSLKDKTDSLLRSSLIYLFKCSVDPNLSYIGKTKRYLVRRIDEHSKRNSAIHDHLHSCTNCTPYNINNSFSVLHRSNNDVDLLILESLYIKQHSPFLNKQLSNFGKSINLNIF